MKVYFTTSYKGVREYGEQIRLILDQLGSGGHTIIKRPLKNYEQENIYNIDEKTVKDIFDFHNSSLNDIYKLTVKRIRESDVVITETSVPSSGVGYELAIAQNEKKPVLALLDNKAGVTLADAIEGTMSRLFSLQRYSGRDDLAGTLGKFFEEAKGMIDTKFILIISPEIDKYLSWAADERRMHKAQVVRNAVEDAMSKDKEYKAFLKSQGLD